MGWGYCSKVYPIRIVADPPGAGTVTVPVTGAGLVNPFFKKGIFNMSFMEVHPAPAANGKVTGMKICVVYADSWQEWGLHKECKSMASQICS